MEDWIEGIEGGGLWDFGKRDRGLSFVVVMGNWCFEG